MNPSLYFVLRIALASMMLILIGVALYVHTQRVQAKKRDNAAIFAQLQSAARSRSDFQDRQMERQENIPDS